MATRTNYVKIGLFVILGLATALGLAVALGAKGTHRDTVRFVTYFNESVQGLDVGAQTTFRGVRIGSVGAITIAPDHRMVEVHCDVDVGAMERMGLWPRGYYKQRRELPRPPPDLRAQLGSQGFTGIRYVLIDFFDPKTNPPPELSFPTPENYVPATKSLSKGLEDSVTKALDGLTALSDAALETIGHVDDILGDLERGHAGDEAVRALVEARTVLRDLDRTAKALDRNKVVDGTSATLESLRAALDKFDKVLDELGGEKGLVAATQRSVAAFGNLGTSANGTARSLDETLTEIRETATSIRLLADEIERDPDALLKGRAGGARP